jgi:hypothetical protein
MKAEAAEEKREDKREAAKVTSPPASKSVPMTSMPSGPVNPPATTMAPTATMPMKK